MTKRNPCKIKRPADFGRVVVLMGGQAAEREVSLRSGQAVYEALRRRGVNAEILDVGADVLIRLQQARYDRAFIALHGRGGEDGVIQGALQTIGLPYTGSGVLGCALSMDKLRTKQMWQAQGLPTAAYAELKTPADLKAAQKIVGFPMAIKPAREGSSIGMAKVEKPEQLLPAFETAITLDKRVIAESWVIGQEYTAAILVDEVLPMIRVETPHKFYDYEAKYRANTTHYHCPCGLSPAREKELADLVLNSFTGLDASGWGRIDFILDSEGRPWLLELNAVPGMTDHSLVPMAARAGGMDFDELVWRVLETSIEEGACGQPPKS
jgi:D-alanine-D-alanine ligase